MDLHKFAHYIKAKTNKNKFKELKNINTGTRNKS